ncbi:MAG: HPr(Ser) kinase/phosphatase [Bacteroidota bacterium]
MEIKDLKIFKKESITVNYLFEKLEKRLGLVKLNECGQENLITDKNLHRPGLALAGYVDLFTFYRVQIIGNTEIFYLQSLNLKNKIDTASKLMQFKIPCVIVTNGNTFDAEILKIATEKNIPIFQTQLETTQASYYLSDFLEDQFAEQSTMHGSFVDIYGVGVMIIGRSGIGKSEIALDLIERGHRLVADDVVNVTRKGESILIGTGNDVVRHYMEIRGLGIIDVQKIFGIRSIRFQKRIEVIVELLEWNKDSDFTRTGLDNKTINIMGTEIQHVKLPIFPGKNITVITEVIALNYLLKLHGHDSAKTFSDRLEKIISEKKGSGAKRIVDYFGDDFE